MSSTNDFIIENGVLKKYIGNDRNVVIPEGVVSISESGVWNAKGAFSDCVNLTSVIIPEGVTSIEMDSFSNCRSLISVTIPKSVTRIGEFAFFRCVKLIDIPIPDSVTNIAESAFRGCKGLADKDGFVVVAGHLFGYYGTAKEIVIPDGVCSIGSSVFSNYHNLTSVLIPDSVKTIGDSAFYPCENLKTLKIPHTVQKVEMWALRDVDILFMDTTSLQNIKEIPGGEVIVVSLIEENAVVERFVTSKKDVCAEKHALYELKIVQKGVMNYQKYDDYILNGSKKFKLKASGKLRAVLYRFQYPNKLSDAMRAEYITYARKNLKKLIAVAEEDQEPELVKALLQSGTVDNSNKKTLAKLLQASTVPEIAALVAELDKLVIEKATAPKKLEAKSAETNVISPLEQEYLARYEKLGGEKRLRKIGILPAQLPQVKLRNSEDFAPSCMVAYLILAYGRQYINTKNYHFTIDPEADSAAALLDPASLSAGLLTLFDQINAVENIPIIPSCCRYCDPKGASHLIAAFRKWDKWSEFGQRGRNAEYIGFDAMVLSDTKEAVMFVDKNNRLSNYAAIRGTDADTIRDTVLMDFGLDADGKKAYDLGSKTVVATVSKELAVELLDTAANKVIKSIPKKGTDPELAAAAAAHFSDMKKNVKKAVKARNDLLFEQFLSGASRPAPAWKASYGTNPLLHRVAELVVWKQDNDTFILTADGAIDCCGSAYEIRDDIPIAVAHPMEMSSACVLAWQRYFTSNNLKQPFAQIWEPVIDPTTISEGRYKDCMIPLYRFLKMEKHGIYVTDEDFHSEIYVELDGCNADVERIDWERHALDPNHRFRINSISFGAYTRQTNHIIAYLDQITVNGRILRDDVTIADNLPQFTLAQITEFIKLATENNCTNVTALLLDYKQKTFSDFDPMEEFTLE